MRQYSLILLVLLMNGVCSITLTPVISSSSNGVMRSNTHGTKYVRINCTEKSNHEGQERWIRYEYKIFRIMKRLGLNKMMEDGRWKKADVRCEIDLRSLTVLAARPLLNYWNETSDTISPKRTIPLAGEGERDGVVQISWFPLFLHQQQRCHLRHPQGRFSE